MGGKLTAAQLRGLLGAAAELGDGHLHLTKRANVQIRAVSDVEALAETVEALGLLPSRSHELVRNILVSPTGSLQPVAEELDRLLCASPALAALPARFLFAFDDRGDLAGLGPDLGIRVGEQVQLLVGGRLGEELTLESAPQRIIDLAHRFLDVRGDGPSAAWRIAELAEGAVAPAHAEYVGEPDLTTQIDVPDGVLTPELADALPPHDSVAVTPWHGLVAR